MPRNLDITALRSFVTVADTGSVTRASGYLNLTQSAVSMQLKRLEMALGQQLLDRSARAIALTSAGEQILGYALRMLELNDELLERLSDQEVETEIVLGVPYDIVYPAMPEVLKRFNAEFPRVKVQLVSSYTNELKERFANGSCEIILTTESAPDAGGETLATLPMNWVGAPHGKAWRRRPLRVAFCSFCRFRQPALRALDEADIPWELAIDSGFDRAIEATISADLAVGAMLDGAQPPHIKPITDTGVLPDLPAQQINLYAPERPAGRAVSDLVAMIRQAYVALKTPNVVKFG
ncbi:MAG: LysR family transcriptional regulator [Rhodobacter sp.]|nr:LysR family transcriptional regulator [Rhodobacter sp.]